MKQVVLSRLNLACTKYPTNYNIYHERQTSFKGKTCRLRLNRNLSSLLTDGEDFLVSKSAEHSWETTSYYSNFRFIDHEAFLDDFNAYKLLQLFSFRFLNGRNFASRLIDGRKEKQRKKIFKLFRDFERFLKIIALRIVLWQQGNWLNLEQLLLMFIQLEAPQLKAAIIWVNKHLQSHSSFTVLTFISQLRLNDSFPSLSRLQFNCSKLIKSECEDGKIISCAWTRRYWASLQ